MADLELRDDSLPGRHGTVPVRRYVPREVQHPAPLIWMHGGAFAYGSLDMPESDAVARAIAETGREVISVDYRLVPPFDWWRTPRRGQLGGVRFPIPVEDVIDAIKGVRGDHEEVVIGGASAGACLAAAATRHLVESGVTGLAALVLIYGAFHATLPPISPELRKRIRGRHAIGQFRRRTIVNFNRNYAGSAEAVHDPLAFPGGHDLHGMPRTLLIDADRDSLRASGEQFARELAAAGVDTTYGLIEGSTHGFLDRPSEPEFARGIQEIVRWLPA